MIKKFFIIVVFLVLLSLFFSLKPASNLKDKSKKDNEVFKKEVEVNLNQDKKQLLPTKIVSPKDSLVKSIFIPYWSSSFLIPTDSYQRFFYFGITVNQQGINKNESGYQKLNDFLLKNNSSNWWLVLRMIDEKINDLVLENKDLQNKIVEESLKLCQERGFNGLALDLETSNYLDNNMRTRINDFIKLLYSNYKKNYKNFSVILYGDLFYRKRPYDVSFIEKNSDEVLVMAYDFSKTIGEPGPNFPLESGHKYNYSFMKMVDDFLIYVPAEKLTVIFGMYGYQWNVDEEKRPISRAKALTLTEIKNKFYQSNTPIEENLGAEIYQCKLKDCLIKRDKISSEVEINYFYSSDSPDAQGIYRIDYYVVWHEDEKSVEKKTEFLEEKGINSIGYWAFEYF